MTTATGPAGRAGAPHPFVIGVVVFTVVAAAVAAVVLARAAWDDHTAVTTGEHGSGVGVTQRREVPPFTGVELAGSNLVTVRVGVPRSVVVHADENLVDRVTTTVRSDQLVIGSRGSYTAESPMRVQVGVPSLTSTTLTGSGTVRIEGVDGEAFTALLPGSGVLTVDGTTGRLAATLSGSGDMRLQDLVAQDVHARVEGTGLLRVHAAESLDATVSGAGAIRYGGSPDRVTQDITGAGSIAPE
jgi:hypothetical protein